MNLDYQIFRSPLNGLPLSLQEDKLISTDHQEAYPVIMGIPRFVSPENYASDFGLQWKKFPRTQLDSFVGVNISGARLSRCLNGHLKTINGKKILEAGSGAGRFTEILLAHGAEVHSFDFSQAVEANALNNGHANNLSLAQADIRSIPYQKASYDYVICLGVLQHTPNTYESISKLWEMVKPGGYLVIDHYRFKWRNIIPPPFGIAEPIYRKYVLSLPQHERFECVRRLVDFWFPVHWKFKNSKSIQRVLRRISPVHFYYGELPLATQEQFYEWALLDTHDATTDFFKRLETIDHIYSHLKNLGAEEISVNKGGIGLEAFCKKPSNN